MSKKPFRVVDRDLGWKKMARRMARMAMKDHHLQVGWWASDNEDAAQRALWNEVAGDAGVTTKGKAPPRPVLVPLIDANRKRYIRDVVNRMTVQHLFGKMPIEQVLAMTGILIAEEAREVIKNYTTKGSQFKHNAESTIDKKGFDSPLIETGVMMKNLTYRVTR